MTFIKRVAQTQVGQLLHAQALDDSRTLMEKAQDQAIGQARLLINSALNIQDGYTFVAELEVAQNRTQRQAVIEKWRAYVGVLKTQANIKETSPMSQFRASKAAEVARAIGWTVEYSKYGNFERIYWKSAE